jgi:hypothetical protein
LKVALDSHRPRGGGVAVRVDTGVCIGAGLHQHADHRRQTLHYCVVQRTPLIAVRPLHVGQIRPELQYASDPVDVVRAGRRDELFRGDPIDVPFELGPAIEAVRAGHDQLRVVKGERAEEGLAATRSSRRVARMGEPEVAG